MEKPQVLEHTQRMVNYAIYDCKWIPVSTKLVVLGSLPNSNGILQIYELNDRKLEKIKQNVTRNAYKCGTFGATSLHSHHMAIGNFKGQLQLLDLERLDVPIYTALAHKGLVNAIDAIGGKEIECSLPEIVTGGRDGAVRVWDLRQKGNAAACLPAGSDDCWAVAVGDGYSNLNRCIAAGFSNGSLKLYDLRAMATRWETTLKSGICGIEFDQHCRPINKMTAVTVEGCVRVFDMRIQCGMKGYAYVEERNAGRAIGTNGVGGTPKTPVLTVRHLPQNRDLFATCGGTGCIRLWHYKHVEHCQGGGDGTDIGALGSLQLLNASTISAQAVHCLDWHPDKLGLAVCGSFDQIVRVLVSTKLKSYDQLKLR